jgi:membrane-associated phospholipid phosphatase
MLPPLVGKAERTRTLLVALVFSSLATLVTFAFFRAIGPWEGTLAGTPIQRGCSQACRALEDGAPYVVDLRRPDPLIAFPSWHAILAVLSAITLARIRWLAAPAIVWGALVVASTVTTGWHYAIDTLAGVAVAALAWTVASREPLRSLTDS